MSLVQWLAILSSSGFILMIGLGIFYFLRAKKSNDYPIDYGTSTSSWKGIIDTNSQKLYLNAIRIPLLKSIVRNVRTRIETLAIYDEYSLRRQVMVTLYKIIAILFTLIILLLLIRPNWVVVFWCFLGCLFLASFLVDIFVHRVEMRLLKQLKDFNNRIRNFYHETKNVERSVDLAISYAGPEMKVQANRIYDILTSVDPEEEFSKYELVVPSKYLKGVTGLLLMVKEQGDVISSEGSSLLNGLSSINEELNTETSYRSQLNYQMKGFPIIAIVPVFAAAPQKMWATQYFSIMRTFYESQLGFILEVLGYTLAVLFYMMFRKMAEVNEARYHAKVKNVKWEKWMLEKIPFMQTFITRITPGPNTKKYLVLSKLLKDANSGLKLDWLTVQRVVLTISVLVIFVVGLWFSHEREKRSVLYNVIPFSMLTSNVTESEYQVFQEATDFDREIILQLKKGKEVTPGVLEEYVAASLGVEDLTDPQFNQIHNRIAIKFEKYRNAYFKWYEFLFSLIVAFGAWYLPVLSLKFNRHMRFKNMEKEIHQFLVWISILRRFDRVNIPTILIWLHRMGTVFKDPIQNALQDYDAGPELALENLGENVNFDPFNQIVARLKLSITRISIQEAFDDIEMERSYYVQQLQEDYRRSLLLKEEWSSFLCYVPVLFLILANFLLPLLYLSFVGMQDMIGNIMSY